MVTSDLRRVLAAVGIALIGTYIVTVASIALPVRLLQPDWINRICNLLVDASSFPLIGGVFLLIAAEAFSREKDRADNKLELPLITSLRRVYLVMALVVFVVIPLQAWSGVNSLRQAIQIQQSQLTPMVRALELIRLAPTPDALLGVIRSIPGAQNTGTGQFVDPLPKVKEQLITQIAPQIKARQQQLDDQVKELWQQGILRWIKQGLFASFSFLGFAAIGRPGPGQPTLLQSLSGIARIFKTTSSSDLTPRRSGLLSRWKKSLSLWQRDRAIVKQKREAQRREKTVAEKARKSSRARQSPQSSSRVSSSGRRK